MRTFGVLIVVLALAMANPLLHSASTTNGWKSQGRANSKEMVFVQFAVKQNNLGRLNAFFWDVSNPKSENYGKYLSFEQLGELIKNQNGTDAVVGYLNDIKAQEIKTTPHGEYVTASIPVETAEMIFQAEIHNFTHIHEMFRDQNIMKATSYVVPEELAAHITHVDHLTYFPDASRLEPIFGDADEDGVVTPQFIYEYYGISNSVASSGKATQSVFAALGQSFSPDDLSTFQKAYSLDGVSVSTVIGNNQGSICKEFSNSCREANLDVQYMTAVAQDVNTTFWRIDEFSSNPFADWVNQLNSYGEIPLVHSISYGATEGPDFSDSFMKTFNQEMQKLGARGVTVTAASGDDGAMSAQVRMSTGYCAYSPAFPATSPYVTAVGATQGPEDGGDEVACSSDTGGMITTGGGFSTIWDAPDYQSSHTQNYLNTVSPQPQSGYNAGGRGIPDVSFLGHNYIIVLGGSSLPVSGTSASSPAFAGVVSLVNDARLAAGKSSLGFLNQALYSLDSSVYNDITSGNNKCGASNGQTQNCCDVGYTATTGWDPLTGLGTPKFEAFLSALLEL